MSKKDTKTIEQAKPKNPILKEVKLRPNEENVKELAKTEYQQLEYRLLADFWQYLNAINTTLVHTQIILMEIAKKQGINIEQILDDTAKTDHNLK